MEEGCTPACTCTCSPCICNGTLSANQLCVNDLNVLGDATFGSLLCNGRAIQSYNITVPADVSLFAVPQSIPRGTMITFLGPKLPGGVCVLPPGVNLPLGFSLRVLNFDPLATASLTVIPSPNDLLYLNTPPPTANSLSKSVVSSQRSLFLWLGSYWLSFF